MATKLMTRLSSLTIALAYFAVSGLWTLFADKIFAFLLNQPAHAGRSVGPSHWFFIALSTGMLYWLLRYWDVASAEAQESLRIVNRSLRTVSDCTKAITRTEDEQQLMQSICRICVEVGGHCMAWVAFAGEEPEKKLRPVAHWGAEDCYLETLQASWDDTEFGRGPAGTSIRTGKITVFQDLLTNPRYRPWHAAAKKYGYRSCLALPLIEDGRAFGALIIFNAKPNAFDREEAILLEELSGDLAYGIQALRSKTERQREMEERLILATIIEQTSDGVITFDAKGIIQYINPSFVELCGIPADEGIGVSIHDFECPQRNPIFYQAVCGVFATNEVRTGHFIYKKSDGSEYEIDARIAPVFGDSGQVVRYVATVRDVSQEIALQQQLRQAQKMEALATLSGGIAHDFNNILAIILTNVEMSLEDVPEVSPVRKSLQLILKAGLRGKSLVKQFMTISRQNEQPQKPVQLGDVVTDCFSLLRATLPTTIELRKDIDTGLGLVAADPTQIGQVIMNLCTNAGDAMHEKGGVLDISLREIELFERDMIRYPGLQPGKFVKLIVADTGHGMTREVQSRIFEPFYTTKRQEKGTGLGLAIAHGIIKNHRGTISVNSILGVGTTFIILLPQIDGQKNTFEAVQIVQTTTGQGRILFVDDEADYVTGMKMALERLGYIVMAETDSRKALEFFRKNPEGFDLLISDQTMPHLTGVMLAQEILAIRPDLPIILCSGSSPETDSAVSPEKAKALGICQVLMKPVERNEISRAVQQLLTRDEV